MTTKKSFNVIVDTREKEPWTFYGEASVNTIINQKLDTGDYSVEGLEDILCIERKMGVAEFAGNVFEKRFSGFISRMSEFQHKFLIFEFSIGDILCYPINSGIPKAQWSRLKVKGAYMMSYISDLQIRHGIHMVFGGNASDAEQIAVSIMKKITSMYD